MNLPVSTQMLLAMLTALRYLFLAGMVLFSLVAIRAQFDSEIVLGWGLATGLAAASWLAAGACGLARKAIEARLRQG